MLTEFLDAIHSKNTFTVAPERQVNGRTYLYEEGGKSFKAVKDPSPEALVVHTLAGLRDFVIESLPGAYRSDTGYRNIFAHISGVSEVRLVTALKEPWLNRHTLVSAVPLQKTGFNFGQYLDVESFIVGLQANFHPWGDLDKLLRLASRITFGKEAQVSDDGIGQQVTTKRGVHLRDTEETPNPVRLIPRRGFPEVSGLCPPVEFVFRVRGGGDELPRLALFEADGGAWQIDARAQLKLWIETSIPGLPVIS